MKNLAPAFQFYASDYLADANVQMLTLEEEGAYIRLLAYCWREGDLPADPDALAKLCKGCPTDVITVVARLFILRPDKTRLTHKRLEEERAKQQERRAQQSVAGRRSADIRAKGFASPTSVPTKVKHPLNETPTLQSSSSTSSSSQLASSVDQKVETVGTVKSSTGENNGAEPVVVANHPDSDIVREIYRYFPVKIHDQKALAAIQHALKYVDGLTLLSAVKAFAAETTRTNTTSPTWPEPWFKDEMWKAYLPVPDESERTNSASPEDEQDFSIFPKESYQTN